MIGLLALGICQMTTQLKKRTWMQSNHNFKHYYEIIKERFTSGSKLIFFAHRLYYNLDQPWQIINQTMHQNKLVKFSYYHFVLFGLISFSILVILNHEESQMHILLNFVFSFQVTRVNWSNLWFLRWWWDIWDWRSCSISLCLAVIWAIDSSRETNGLQRGDTTLLPIEISQVFDCFIESNESFWWDLLL